MRYSLICFLLALFIHASLAAQTDSLIVKRWKNDKPIAILTTGSRLELWCKITHDRQVVKTSYNRAIIKNISDSTLIVTYSSKLISSYDSTRYLQTDSSISTQQDSNIVDTIYLNSICSLSSYTNDSKLGVILFFPALLGGVAYFSAPFIAKTTAAGQLNTAVYYSLLAYGVVGVLSLNYLVVRSYFGPSPSEVSMKKPTKKRSRSVYIVTK